MFIGTLSSLVSQDFGLIDIYDARVNGGLLVPRPRRRECEGSVCWFPLSSPELPSLASSGFTGPGNFSDVLAGVARCVRGVRKAKIVLRRAKVARRKAKRMARRGVRGRALRMSQTSRRLVKRARAHGGAAKRCWRSRGRGEMR